METVGRSMPGVRGGAGVEALAEADAGTDAAASAIVVAAEPPSGAEAAGALASALPLPDSAAAEFDDSAEPWCVDAEVAASSAMSIHNFRAVVCCGLAASVATGAAETAGAAVDGVADAAALAGLSLTLTEAAEPPTDDTGFTAAVGGAAVFVVVVAVEVVDAIAAAGAAPVVPAALSFSASASLACRALFSASNFATACLYGETSVAGALEAPQQPTSCSISTVRLIL